MADIRGPQCRQCRREGEKLFLKGSKCFSAKCPVEKRNAAPPGQHNTRRGRLSDYGVMLRMKQKVRRIYGMFERQFRRFYQEATQQKGAAGVNLMQMLEARLDSVVYRMGFGISRRQARQLISHRSIMVNGKTVNIPAYFVQPGDTIAIAPKAAEQLRIKEALDFYANRGEHEWIAVDRDKLQGTFKRVPERDELPADINEQLIVEFYSK
jgi:small subunit ribosomal protein S4